MPVVNAQNDPLERGSSQTIDRHPLLSLEVSRYMNYAHSCNGCVVFDVEIVETEESTSDVRVVVWDDVFDVSYSLEGVTSKADEYSTQTSDNKH